MHSSEQPLDVSAPAWTNNQVEQQLEMPAQQADCEANEANEAAHNESGAGAAKSKLNPFAMEFNPTAFATNTAAILSPSPSSNSALQQIGLGFFVCLEMATSFRRKYLFIYFKLVR